MQIGIIGLGRIGGGLALQAREKGIEVVGFDPSFDPELEAAGVVRASSLEDLAARLTGPRRIFLYVHAGALVDATLEGLAGFLSPEDVVADGGNSYWKNSKARALRWAGQFRFVDLGTSGGLTGARNGACFMAGGERDAVSLLEPVLEALGVPGGYVYCGPSGSGHFVKLVHNGIEFGMLQAIGEGMHLLEAYPDALPVEEVLGCWQNGSVVRSWLVDLMKEEYAAHGSLDPVPGYIEDTGEVNWLVADALEMEVPVPVISLSVMQLFASRDEAKPWARAVAMMRHGFGGHPYGPDGGIASERRTSRVD